MFYYSFARLTAAQRPPLTLQDECKTIITAQTVLRNYARHGCVHFEEWGATPNQHAAQRWTIHTSTPGFGSAIDTALQRVHVSTSHDNTRGAAHEIGHMLGLEHTHQRSDCGENRFEHDPATCALDIMLNWDCNPRFTDLGPYILACTGTHTNVEQAVRAFGWPSYPLPEDAAARAMPLTPCK